jgi:hypothetical protein
VRLGERIRGLKGGGQSSFRRRCVGVGCSCRQGLCRGGSLPGEGGFLGVIRRHAHGGCGRWRKILDVGLESVGGLLLVWRVGMGVEDDRKGCRRSVGEDAKVGTGASLVGVLERERGGKVYVDFVVLDAWVELNCDELALEGEMVMNDEDDHLGMRDRILMSVVGDRSVPDVSMAWYEFVCEAP